MKQQNVSSLQYNTKVQTYLRAVIALIAGSSAGYLGIHGLNGLYYWLIFSAVGTILECIKTKGNADQYFGEKNSGIQLIASTYFTLTTSLGLTYVLFWTFFYNIVHVYS